MKLRSLLALFCVPLSALAQTSIPIAKDGVGLVAPIYTVPVSGLDSANKAQMVSTDSAGHLLGLKAPTTVSSTKMATSAANAAVTLTLSAATTAWEVSSLQVCTGGGTIATLADAVGTLTGSSSVAPSDGDTIVINGKTYTFKTTLTVSPGVEGQVLIGTTGSTDAAYLNLSKAILQTGTQGTNYWVAAASPYVTSSPSGHNLGVTALIPGSQGNAITTTAAGSAPGSWGGATLASGAGIDVQIKDGTTVVKNLTIAAIGQDKFVFDPPLVFTAAGAISVTAGAGGSGVITSLNLDAFQQ